MQNNRLFEIVYLLLERKTMTAKELADRFEVSTRTIYRDVEILSNSHIPIYCSKGKGGGIHLLEDFVLDKSLLSETEQKQILFALQSLEKLKVADSNILDKMHRLFRKEAKDWIQIDFSNWGTSKEIENTFDTIKQAILDNQVIQFTYYNTYGQKKIRIVEPIQIWFKDKSWYLKAYCREKEDFRIFKIARMKHIRKLNETFERSLPEEKQEEEWKIETVILELKIDKKLAYRVYDEFEESQIELLQNGDFYVKVTYPKNDWIYGYLLSFGEDIQVIKPVSIKKELQQTLQKMLKNYSK